LLCQIRTNRRDGEGKPSSSHQMRTNRHDGEGFPSLSHQMRARNGGQEPSVSRFKQGKVVVGTQIMSEEVVVGWQKPVTSNRVREVVVVTVNVHGHSNYERGGGDWLAEASDSCFERERW